MTEQYVSVAEFAAITRRHPETIRTAIRSGEIPAARSGPRGWYMIPVERALQSLENAARQQLTRRVSWLRRRSGAVL